MDNKQIIEKAAMTLADLASGGQLNPEQSNKFLQMVQDAPTIIRSSRFVPMKSDSRKIEKVGFGNRILRPAQEGVALKEEDKAKPSTDTVTLNAKEVIAEVNITYDTLENNIEGDNFRNTLMKMIAERAALDLEELILNGDTSASDAYLKLLDGIRKQATSHVYDHAGGGVDRALFKALYKQVPAKYLRNPKQFRFYTSHGTQIEYMDTIAARQSNLGDAAVEGKVPTAFGVPVEGIAMLQPYDTTVDENPATVSDAILTHPKNILVGMSRNISVEVDKDIRERKFIIVLTAKVDAKFEEEDAVAKAINISE